jgi:hypothetical protein
MTAGSYCRQQGSKLNHIIQMLVFRGVDLSLIFCVDLSVYELNFMTDKDIVQSQVGSSLWQVDPDFKVQFLLLVRVLLYGFHWGYLSLTLVHAPHKDFVKRTILLISWNEINRLLFFLICVHM